MTWRYYFHFVIVASYFPAFCQDHVYHLPDTIHVNYIQLKFNVSNAYVKSAKPVEINYFRINDSVTYVQRFYLDVGLKSFRQDFEISSKIFDGFVQEIRQLDIHHISKSVDSNIFDGGYHSLELGNDLFTVKISTHAANIDTIGRGLTEYLSIFEKIFYYNYKAN